MPTLAREFNISLSTVHVYIEEQRKLLRAQTIDLAAQERDQALELLDNAIEKVVPHIDGEVSPTTGTAIPYTVEGETAPAPTPATGAAPTVPVGGNLLPGGVSGEPVPGGGRAVPGVAPEAAPASPGTQAAPGAGGGVVGPGSVVAPGAITAGTPNATAAKVWAGRALEPKALGRALARLGIQFGSNPKAATALTARSDGALFLTYTPTGEEMWDNATLNEESWHLFGLITLRAECDAAWHFRDRKRGGKIAAVEICNGTLRIQSQCTDGERQARRAFAGRAAT